MELSDALMPVGLVSPSVIQYNSLDFVRSGWVNLKNSALRSFGFDGDGWSRVASTYSSPTSATAYYLYFNPSDVGSSRSNPRWQGFPVRCLVILVVRKQEYLFVDLRNLRARTKQHGTRDGGLT